MSPSEPQGHPASRSFGSHGVSQTQHQVQLQIPPHLQHQPPPPPSLPQLQPQPQAQPVNIQPRPAPNGFAASPSTSSPKVSTTPTGTGRKRGRPSRADREAWARAKTTQSSSYAPITPAPIAPQPAPVQTQTTYSPSPVGPPAYQISSTAPASDPKPKSKAGRPSGVDHQQRSESVPRSIQPIASPDTRDHHDVRGQQSKSEKEEDWRERASQTGQTAKHPSPIPMEPPVHQGSPLDRHSGSPFAASALREVIGPAMEHTRNEGHPPVANQA